MGSDEIFLNVFHFGLKTCPYIWPTQILFLTILANKLQEKRVTFQIIIYEFDKDIIVFLHHKHHVYNSIFWYIKESRIQLVILLRITELRWPEFI